MKNSIIIGIGILILIISCNSSLKIKESTSSLNYVDYYNRVYEIDSLLRYKKDTIEVIAKYHKLFSEFQPKHTAFIEEYETYIVLSDKKNKDFGGKESLKKLIPLIAPFWKYRKSDKSLFSLYEKHGIDSLGLVNEVKLWNESLNSVLVDSFSIASIRDQEFQRSDAFIQDRNDKKNFKLLLWAFDNYGYPSKQKIGLFNKKNEFLKVGLIIHHAAGSDSYEEIKKRVWEYVKSGDCDPGEYASMVDRHHNLKKEESEFGYEYMFGLQPLNNKIDTVQINKNRKKIGVPSIKYHKTILPK